VTDTAINLGRCWTLPATESSSSAHGSLLWRRLSRGRGLERRHGAPALVGVNVVRPVGRCTLTPRARRHFGAAIEATPDVDAAGERRSVAGAGPGCG
jgi:hypothetical protein